MCTIGVPHEFCHSLKARQRNGRSSLIASDKRTHHATRNTVIIFSFLVSYFFFSFFFALCMLWSAFNYTIWNNYVIFFNLICSILRRSYFILRKTYRSSWTNWIEDYPWIVRGFIEFWKCFYFFYGSIIFV